LLDAAKQRFAKARIVLVSPEKNYQIFAADPRIEHLAAPYRREGSLAERLSVYPSLRTALSTPDSIVIDPDSRLTQLGLLPVCDSDRYYFFESRAYGGFSEDTLGTLTSQWARHIFDVDTPKAFLAPGEDAGVASITVSLGVGENPAKRIAGSFERQALGLLAAAGQSMLVDRGASADEGARVDAAIMGLPNARSFTGPFAKFCGSIAKSRLYFGYDSAGQHAAAAAGVPLIAIFAGHASARFFSRWRPSGPGVCHTVRVDGQTPDSILQELATLLDQIDSR
jgi:ADP-heptose:LPS heptosyltransferase